MLILFTCKYALIQPVVEQTKIFGCPPMDSGLCYLYDVTEFSLILIQFHLRSAAESCRPPRTQCVLDVSLPTLLPPKNVP